MRISEICIRRPVFATVLSLIVMLIGVVSFDRLSVREYPKIDEPVVTVTTVYRGASSEIVESAVTKPLEDSIAGIDGIEVITSISRPERSQITVRFRLDREPDGAAADVRDRTSRVRQKLPIGVDEPVIAKVEADATPIIHVALSSPGMSQMDVSDVANRILKPRLQTLPGAADVRIWGERPKTVLFVTHSITEAVVLADRVVVMSPRPGRIAEIIEVKSPRPRSFDNEASPEFHEATHRIRQLIFGQRHVGPGRAAA